MNTTFTFSCSALTFDTVEAVKAYIVNESNTGGSLIPGSKIRILRDIRGCVDLVELFTVPARVAAPAGFLDLIIG